MKMNIISTRLQYSQQPLLHILCCYSFQKSLYYLQLNNCHMDSILNIWTGAIVSPDNTVQCCMRACVVAMCDREVMFDIIGFICVSFEIKCTVAEHALTSIPSLWLVSFQYCLSLRKTREVTLLYFATCPYTIVVDSNKTALFSLCFLKKLALA